MLISLRHPPSQDWTLTTPCHQTLIRNDQNDSKLSQQEYIWQKLLYNYKLCTVQCSQENNCNVYRITIFRMADKWKTTKYEDRPKGDMIEYKIPHSCNWRTGQTQKDGKSMREKEKNGRQYKNHLHQSMANDLVYMTTMD